MWMPSGECFGYEWCHNVTSEKQPVLKRQNHWNRSANGRRGNFQRHSLSFDKVPDEVFDEGTKG